MCVRRKDMQRWCTHVHGNAGRKYLVLPKHTHKCQFYTQYALSICLLPITATYWLYHLFLEYTFILTPYMIRMSKHHTLTHTYACIVCISLTNDNPAIVACWGRVLWLQYPGLPVQFIHDIPELLVVT